MIPDRARYFFREINSSPKWCETPPLWCLVSHKHICAIPHFTTYRAIIVRCPTRTSTKLFCDTIATSIARYKKHRCWASKSGSQEPKLRAVSAIPRKHMVSFLIRQLQGGGQQGRGRQCLRRPWRKQCCEYLSACLHP